MFRRNPGRFTCKITMLRPSAPVRDELGGVAPTVYSDALTCFAMCTDKNQTRQQVIGDYVTVDTRYFLMRDVRSQVQGLDTSWRLRYNGYVYLINKVDLIDDGRPYYLQLTATAINCGGGAL